PGGNLVACRTPVDHLIVCGISNWGAYGLAAGVRLLRGKPLDADLLDPRRELQMLELMVRQGPLVDGVSGDETATVDGLSFGRYIEPLRKIAAVHEERGAESGDRGNGDGVRTSGAPAQQSLALHAHHAAEVRRRARSGELTTHT